MKQLREKVGLSTVDVAYQLKVAESTVRNWDSGRTLPTFAITEVPKVLALYGCTLEEMAATAEQSRAEFLKRDPAADRA